MILIPLNLIILQFMPVPLVLTLGQMLIVWVSPSVALVLQQWDRKRYEKSPLGVVISVSLC